MTFDKREVEWMKQGAHELDIRFFYQGWDIIGPELPIPRDIVCQTDVSLRPFLMAWIDPGLGGAGFSYRFVAYRASHQWILLLMGPDPGRPNRPRSYEQKYFHTTEEIEAAVPDILARMKFYGIQVDEDDAGY